MIAAGFEHDHPQPLPVRHPAPDVLPAQVGLDDRPAAGVVPDQGRVGGLVDQEGLVEAGLDPVQGLGADELRQRHPALPNLRHQPIHLRRFQAPGGGAVAGPGHGVAVLVDIVLQGQLGGTVAGDRADPNLGRVCLCRRLRRARVGDEDAGEGVGVLEDGGMAEIQHLLDLGPRAEQPAQGLPIAGPQPFVGDDVAQLAVGGEQFQAALVEIAIEVGDPVVGRVPLGQIGLVGSQEFLADIGRVADHHVEAAAGENLWEGGAPIEGAGVGRQGGEGGGQGRRGVRRGWLDQ